MTLGDDTIDSPVDLLHMNQKEKNNYLIIDSSNSQSQLQQTILPVFSPHHSQLSHTDSTDSLILTGINDNILLSDTNLSQI